MYLPLQYLNKKHVKCGTAVKKSFRSFVRHHKKRVFDLVIYFQSMLVFPEVLTKEEVEDLNLMVQPIEKFFLEDCKLTHEYHR